MKLARNGVVMTFVRATRYRRLHASSKHTRRTLGVQLVNRLPDVSVTLILRASMMGRVSNNTSSQHLRFPRRLAIQSPNG